MVLYPRIVGTHCFDERPITATDPRYDAGTSYTIENINVKPGKYECVAWKGRLYYKDDNGKRKSYQRVFKCGIYHINENFTGEEPKEKIGEIGVDTGLAGFFQDKPNYDNEAYKDLHNRTHIHDYLIIDEGFLTSTGWGDGIYPVYAYRNSNGEIFALEIDF